MSKAFLIALLALIAFDVYAQWRVVTELLFEDEEPAKVALVEDGAGHSLRVHRDTNGTVWAIFKIRDGFEALAEESCPTYRVDRRQAVNVPASNPRCILETKRAHFTLGDVDGNQVRSRALLQLMNGRLLVIRYHLANHGYREIRFSLAGSKQALLDVLGRDVSVEVE